MSELQVAVTGRRHDATIRSEGSSRARFSLPANDNRSSADTTVQHVGTARMPTDWGIFTVQSFRDSDGWEHLALSVDEPGDGPQLVRIHSECMTGDIFGSHRCDCGPQLHESMRRIQEAGRGAVVYLRGHEGRGMGIAAKIAAYALQDHGFDTVDANLELGYPVDTRDYSVAAVILRYLGLTRVSLLTNNPDKVHALVAQGISVVERVPLVVQVPDDAVNYLRTKRDRLGHHLPTD